MIRKEIIRIKIRTKSAIGRYKKVMKKSKINEKLCACLFIFIIQFNELIVLS